jgi:hypothetical protein
MMFLNCPAYLDYEGGARCGLPAEVRCRFTMRSTDGPIESAMIRCPAGHCFSGAIESLTWDGTDKHDPGTAAAASPTGRDSLQRGHDDRRGGGGSAQRDFPAKPGRNARRPNTAPAYYLGHPAALWITAMRPAPQAHRLPSPHGSRRPQRSPHPGPRRAPAQLTPQSSARVNRSPPDHDQENAMATNPALTQQASRERDDPVVTSLVPRARNGEQQAWDALVERSCWTVMHKFSGRQPYVDFTGGLPGPPTSRRSPSITARRPAVLPASVVGPGPQPGGRIWNILACQDPVAAVDLDNG